MRVLGVDFGRRRIGLALSDPGGILARPWRTIAAGADAGASAGQVAALVADLGGEDAAEGIAAIVVGLPRRLSGEDTHDTAAAREFAAALGRAAGVAVHLQDERLTSREADARLAEREGDWRRRKARIDAMAAAIILQDYLDARGRAEAQATSC